MSTKSHLVADGEIIGDHVSNDPTKAPIVVLGDIAFLVNIPGVEVSYACRRCATTFESYTECVIHVAKHYREAAQ